MSASKTKWVRLGDYIEQSLERNSKNLYGENHAIGVNIEKEMRTMRGNISEKKFDNFFIVPPGYFAYNPRGSRKLGLGLNNSQNTYIITFNNIVFHIKESATTTIKPEYLYIFLSRKEWDRKAEFLSWGSSTEVFSWDTLCDIKIPLPPSEVQQELVDTYNGLKSLAEQNEALIEPLSKACEAFIVNSQKKYKTDILGKYIDFCDERNSKGTYTLDDVRGISTNKVFIPTKADMKGVSLLSYKVVKPLCFAYVADTSRRGDKIALALNNTANSLLISSIYTTFYCKEKLLPEYLYLLLSRSEFDRYSRFNSWGSARETFDWEELCRVKIPLPPIEVQQSIVNLYHCMEEAKKIASEAREKLKEICPALIQKAIHQ